MSADQPDEPSAASIPAPVEGSPPGAAKSDAKGSKEGGRRKVRLRFGDLDVIARPEDQPDKPDQSSPKVKRKKPATVRVRAGAGQSRSPRAYPQLDARTAARSGPAE